MSNDTDGSNPGGSIYVNGRFLGRPVTGVERFAGMILREIDALAQDDRRFRWEILAPAGVERPDFIEHLPLRTIGGLQGHAWEQADLWRAASSGTLLNLCNSGPVLHGRQLTVIHDALVYRHPENFSKAYGTVHRLLGRLLSRRSELATVSEFSRSELSRLLHVPAARITVVPNAVDHMAHVRPDFSVLEDFSLAAGKFLLFVGSPAPNKNLLRAISAFRELNAPDYAFVIVGSAAKTFAASAFGELPAHVIATGRLSDEQIQALYQKAAALVFPSTYEGFGIPPLEAMSAGCAVLAADIPPVREVCRDAALYFNPLDVAAIAGAMRQITDGGVDLPAIREKSRRRSLDFSWRSSALLLMQRVSDIANRQRSRTGRHMHA